MVASLPSYSHDQVAELSLDVSHVGTTPYFTSGFPAFILAILLLLSYGMQELT